MIHATRKSIEAARRARHETTRRRLSRPPSRSRRGHEGRGQGPPSTPRHQADGGDRAKWRRRCTRTGSEGAQAGRRPGGWCRAGAGHDAGAATTWSTPSLRKSRTTRSDWGRHAAVCSRRVAPATAPYSATRDLCARVLVSRSVNRESVRSDRGVLWQNATTTKSSGVESQRQTKGHQEGLSPGRDEVSPGPQPGRSRCRRPSSRRPKRPTMC
jgi:hypothetical protein